MGPGVGIALSSARLCTAEEGIRRVGVFGGTFDPPHLGHLTVAQEVAREARLDRVLWVPASRPPHKTAHAPAPGAIRLRMVRAAIQDHPLFRASGIEVERGGVSYTIDTLRQLRSEFPHWRLALIVGADLFGKLDAWREAAEIRELAEVIVTSRPGVDFPPAAGCGPGVRTVAVTPVDLSSSQLRERIERGLTVSDMVSPAVLAILENEGLYSSRRKRER